MQDVFIVSAARTPIGKFGGAFKDLSAVDLGAHAIRGALDRAAITGADLDFYVMGNVLRAGLGQLVARQAAIQAGVPEDIDGLSIDMVCSSGMMAVMNAAALIKAGDAEIVLAGGTESMSNAGFVLSSGARWGYKYLATAGAEPLRDVMQRDGLSDPFTGEAMGDQAERLAAEYGVTRADLDGIAADSHRRAAEAQSGAFDAEIVPVDVTTRKGTTTVSHDEGIRRDTTTETLATLRPAFSKTGVLTAGSASQISDGAAALVLASEAAVKTRGLKPIARIVGGAWSAGAPWRFPEAPIPAREEALRQDRPLGRRHRPVREQRGVRAQHAPLHADARRRPRRAQRPRRRHRPRPPDRRERRPHRDDAHARAPHARQEPRPRRHLPRHGRRHRDDRRARLICADAQEAPVGFPGLTGVRRSY